MQNHAQPQIVIGFVNFVYHIIIKRLHAGNPPIQRPFLQEAVRNTSDKYTENIANSKVHPFRFFFCLF